MGTASRLQRCGRLEKWRFGADEPASTLGNDGEYYFRSEGPQIWRKLGAAWSILIDFADGRTTWHSGFGPPAANLGNKGDQYLQFGNGFVYEKTSATFWSFRFDLTGTPSGVSDVDYDPRTGFFTYTMQDGSTRTASWNPGVDTPNRESIFIRTRTLVLPTVPANSLNVDDYNPDPTLYTDDKVGTDATNKYEWEFVRLRGNDGVWGPWIGPALRDEKLSRLDGASEWRLGEEYIVGQRTWLLSTVTLGDNVESVPTYYTCRQKHVASNENKPPNETHWSKGSGAIDVPSGISWYVFDQNNVLRWARSQLTEERFFENRGAFGSRAQHRGRNLSRWILLCDE